MRGLLTCADLAAALRRLAAELEARGEGECPYGERLLVAPGLVLEVPKGDAYRRRIQRAGPGHRTRTNTRTNTRTFSQMSGSSAAAEPEIRPAPGAPSNHARGVRISGSGSGSGSELPKETAAVAKGPDSVARARAAAATAMVADWPIPDVLLAQLEMAPGVTRTFSRTIIRRAALHFAQDPSLRKTEVQWRQIMSRWVCRAWGDPKERAAVKALAEAQPQVGGFHEGPVERLDPPKEWTEQARAPKVPPPPETLELLERLRAQRREESLGGVGDPGDASAPDVDGARAQIGGGRG